MNGDITSHNDGDIGKLIQSTKLTTQPPASMTEADTLIRWMQNLFASEEHLDCTVTCGDMTWKLSKIILTQNPFFAAAFRKTSNFVESQTSTVTLDEEDDPIAVEVLLKHIYAWRYPYDIEKGKLTHGDLTAQDCIRIYAIGEKYQAPTLKAKMIDRFQARMSKDIWIAHIRGSFVIDVKLVYSTTVDTDRGLRAVFAAYGAKHQTELLANDFKQSLLTLYAECPEFGYDMAKACLSNRSSALTA